MPSGSAISHFHQRCLSILVVSHPRLYLWSQVMLNMFFQVSMQIFCPLFSWVLRVFWKDVFWVQVFCHSLPRRVVVVIVSFEVFVYFVVCFGCMSPKWSFPTKGSPYVFTPCMWVCGGGWEGKKDGYYGKKRGHVNTLSYICFLNYECSLSVVNTLWFWRTSVTAMFYFMWHPNS